MPINTSLEHTTALAAIASFINLASNIPDTEEHSNNKEADTSDNKDNKNPGSCHFSLYNNVLRHIWHKVSRGNYI